MLNLLSSSALTQLKWCIRKWGDGVMGRWGDGVMMKKANALL
ncbi:MULTISPECIES: hypothetical protein [Okeania]|nr:MULTISPECIES: hypothetical protein [Okeania]